MKGTHSVGPKENHNLFIFAVIYMVSLFLNRADDRARLKSKARNSMGQLKIMRITQKKTFKQRIYLGKHDRSM